MYTCHKDRAHRSYRPMDQLTLPITEVLMIWMLWGILVTRLAYRGNEISRNLLINLAVNHPNHHHQIKWRENSLKTEVHLIKFFKIKLYNPNHRLKTWECNWRKRKRRVRNNLLTRKDVIQTVWIILPQVIQNSIFPIL